MASVAGVGLNGLGTSVASVEGAGVCARLRAWTWLIEGIGPGITETRGTPGPDRSSSRRRGESMFGSRGVRRGSSKPMSAGPTVLVPPSPELLSCGGVLSSSRASSSSHGLGEARGSGAYGFQLPVDALGTGTGTWGALRGVLCVISSSSLSLKGSAFPWNGFDTMNPCIVELGTGSGELRPEGFVLGGWLLGSFVGSFVGVFAGVSTFAAGGRGGGGVRSAAEETS